MRPDHAPAGTRERQAPVRVMLGGGLLAGALALVALVVGIWPTRGEASAASAMAGGLGVMVVLTLAGLGFGRLLGAGGPAGVLSTVLAFLLPLALLVALFAGMRETTWFDVPGFGFGALAVALAYQVGALLGFRRARVLAWGADPPRSA